MRNAPNSTFVAAETGREEFVLPTLGWTLFRTAQGWRLRFFDGRESWPEPRELQIILAFRAYALHSAEVLRKFGRHAGNCDFYNYEPGKVKTAEDDCDCGLTAAINATLGKEQP